MHKNKVDIKSADIWCTKLMTDMRILRRDYAIGIIIYRIGIPEEYLKLAIWVDVHLRLFIDQYPVFIMESRERATLRVFAIG